MLLAPATHLSHFNLKLNGSQAGKEVMDDLLECTVENSIHLPDLCTFRIHDADFKWIDKETFKEGTAVQIFGGEENDSQLKPLFDGEIIGMDLDLAAHGVPTLTIRCSDRSHRMQRNRLARSFVNVKDSDLVSKIGGEYGFELFVDETSEVHPWVLQNNQTDWEFLNQRAKRVGCFLYLQDKKLFFKRVPTSKTISVEWGMDLRSFRPRVNAASQVSSVMVRSWDMLTKKTILGSSNAPSSVPEIGNSAPGGQAAERAFGPAKMVVVDRPVLTQQEADDLARSICDDIGSEYIEAEGLCLGHPEIKPGCKVEIKNIGQKFSGKYLVTSATHTFTPAEGYSTLFSVSGKCPSGVIAIMDWEGGGHRTQLGGNIVIGIVTDLNDPKNLARVKVKYPWLSEQDASDWVRLSSPMAGPERGIQFIPEIDDEVLVAFEHGDVERPYILGALWNGVDKPYQGTSTAVKDNKVMRRFIRTRVGHIIGFNDDTEHSGIFVRTQKGHKITLDDTNEHIWLESKKGHRIALDDQTDKITIRDKNGSNRIVIDSQGSYINMQSGGDILLKAQGKITLDAQQGISLKSPMNINIVASTNTVVQGQAMAYLIGGMVQINPPAPPPPDVDMPHELGQSGSLQGSALETPPLDAG